MFVYVRVRERPKVRREIRGVGRGSGVHKEEQKRRGKRGKLEGRAQLETTSIPSEQHANVVLVCKYM